jgi:hypothetical protein
MFTSPQAEELRVFLRDKLGLDSFDLGGGWLIFPMEGEVGFRSGDGVRHEISLFCDDIRSTVDELQSKGVEFTHEGIDWSNGADAFISAPGGLSIQLHQASCSRS